MALVDSFSKPKIQAKFIDISDTTLEPLEIMAIALFSSSLAKSGTITALISDPYHPHKDKNGIVELAELELVRQLNLMDNTRAEREFAYREALTAVQDAKFRARLKRDAPLITSQTVFGKPQTTHPSAEPK